jgi:hypothetical protein
MKKFGTPSGAAPGWANEKVGFAGVGAPFALLFFFFGRDFLLPVPFPFLDLFLLELGRFVLEGVVVVPGWGCVEVFCFFPGCVGCGAVCVDVVDVEVEVVVEVEGEVEVELEVDVVGVGVDVEVELPFVDVVLDRGGADVVVDVVAVVVGHVTPTRVPPGGSGTGLEAFGTLTVMTPVGR